MGVVVCCFDFKTKSPCELAKKEECGFHFGDSSKGNIPKWYFLPVFLENYSATVGNVVPFSFCIVDFF